MSRPISVTKVLEMDLPTFRAYIRTEDPPFKALQRYAKTLYYEKDEVHRKMYKIVSRAMKSKVEGGFLLKRRVQGTGERVEEERVYKDTAVNRKKNRVGERYKYVYYRDPELKEIKPKVRRSKSVKSDAGEKRVHRWIQSVQEAKSQLREEGVEVPGWVVLRKEVKQESDELGVLIYERAMKIMKEKKEKQEEECAMKKEKEKFAPK